MSSQAQPSGGQQFQPPHIYQQQRQRLPAQLRQTQYNLATQVNIYRVFVGDG